MLKIDWDWVVWRVESVVSMSLCCGVSWYQVEGWTKLTELMQKSLLMTE